MDIKLAKLMAINYYLTELKKSNLVTPSIGKPYPVHPVTNESMIIHKSLQKIQNIRTMKIRTEIMEMKNNGTLFCKRTLASEKCRFKRKIQFLCDKFKPNGTASRGRTSGTLDKRSKNKKSRERYQARKIKKMIKSYNDVVNNGMRTVINLSSYKMPMAEIFALELGYGFVVTPNNPQKEEEILILEGMRFIDRIGKVDKELRKTTQEVDHIQPREPRDNVVVEEEILFTKPKSAPASLQFSQPKDEQLQNPHTKLLKKEFDELNCKLLSNLKTKTRKHNLPKKIRDALKKLRELVTAKVIDIRKVDKGQMVLVIDYQQREKAESLHINHIASIAADQSSNWEENKLFIESKLKDIFQLKFISANELAAVTGLLAGGRCGKLKNADGSIKFTRALDSNELFVKQMTPYVYPLFKLHKLPMNIVLQTKPDEVAEKIPSRLVVGMSCCQLSRVQCWLESFLTPLAKIYGSFEYIKDSTDMLKNLETTKNLLNGQNINWDNTILYTIDVKALYPSIKFEHLKVSLMDCFTSCTNWSNEQINILIEIIFYTLEHQQESAKQMNYHEA